MLASTQLPPAAINIKPNKHSLFLRLCRPLSPAVALLHDFAHSVNDQDKKDIEENGAIIQEEIGGLYPMTGSTPWVVTR